MELKKYLIFILIFNFTKFLYADIVKPTENLTAYDVVKIQLTALKNNNKPSKNAGIKQTWIFAHPENKKFTGPYERFESMLLGNQYNFLLNHDSHKIKLIMNSKDTYVYNIELISKLLKSDNEIMSDFSLFFKGINSILGIFFLYLFLIFKKFLLSNVGIAIIRLLKF